MHVAVSPPLTNISGESWQCDSATSSVNQSLTQPQLQYSILPASFPTSMPAPNNCQPTIHQQPNNPWRVGWLPAWQAGNCWCFLIFSCLLAAARMDNSQGGFGRWLTGMAGWPHSDRLACVVLNWPCVCLPSNLSACLLGQPPHDLPPCETCVVSNCTCVRSSVELFVHISWMAAHSSCQNCCQVVLSEVSW